MNVRTRIAPSPTGYPHIGTMYQVLFDWVYAKQNNGKFILRIEDTDRNRFVEGAEDVIYNCLSWFGIATDEDPVKSGPFGPYRQSERLDIYKKYAQELIDKGNAYYCFCPKEKLENVRKNQEEDKKQPMYDGCCKVLTESQIKTNLVKKIPYVIRMKIPQNRKISFTDLIMGKIEFDSRIIDDQVLIKSDGFPTYHLAVVVDDHLMEISHIFRGREWVSSTPKHILLYEFFGWNIPEHGHLPLILNADGKGKLSKRFGHASVDYYRENGYLPDALFNYLSNIVWNHPQDKEIYSIDEFIKLFDIKKVTSQGARFDLQKLDWVNGEYIRKAEKEKLIILLHDFYKGKYNKHLLEKTIPLIQERIKTLGEYDVYCRFFVEKPNTYEASISSFGQAYQKTAETLEKVKTWKADEIGACMQSVVADLGLRNGEYFMAIRLAITGVKVTPPLNESMEILGKEECIVRLSNAVKS